MKRTGRFYLPLTLAAALGVAFAAGCSDDGGSSATPQPSDQEQIVDLNDPYGGFTNAREAPAFGDADLLATAQEEGEYDDPVASDPTVVDAEAIPDSRIYAMTIVWGMLPNEDSTTVRTVGEDGLLYDWSGGLTLSRGAIVLRGLLSFEREDSIIRPRPDRLNLGWVSHTGVGVDGVRIMIYSTAPDSVAEADTLTFTAGTYTRQFLTTELETLEETVFVDENGNAIRFEAFRIDPTTDRHGFLRGRWYAMAPGDTVGYFNGIWVGSFGRVFGYFRGHYGKNDQGESVIFAKVIDLQGNSYGFWRGTWERLAEDLGLVRPGHGTFRARWLEEGDETMGHVAGRWRAARGRSGALDGRWCLNCDGVNFVMG